jgi:3-hydroxyisobutyrate dehydrogenase
MLSNDAVKEVFENKKRSALQLKIQENNYQYEYSCSRNLSITLQKSALKWIKFIDAPVSGSVKPAQDGTLVILVGTSKANFEIANPILTY